MANETTGGSTVTGGFGSSQDKYVDSLYASFVKKRPLSEHLSTRAAYVYVSLGKVVHPSDLSNENLITFFLSLYPEERKTLFNMIFSIESPKLHYQMFKAFQERLNLYSSGRTYYSIHDAYCYALSLVSRMFYRRFTRDYFHSYSLFVADFLSMSEALSLPPQDFVDLIQDLSQDKSRIQEDLGGDLFFYPRKISGSWKFVRHGDFLSMAPKDEGEVPRFLSLAVSLLP